MLLLILLGSLLTQDIFENSLGLWVYAFLYNAIWLTAEHVLWSVEWNAFELFEAGHGGLELILESLASLVDGVAGEVQISHFFHILTQIFKTGPVRNFVVVDP